MGIVDRFLRQKNIVGTSASAPKKSAPKSNQSPKKPNNQRNQKQFSARSTKSNPNFNRPTVQSREKFHPTNFLRTDFKDEIRVVPLGGMQQVGENMLFIESKDDIIVIDTGLLFPSPEHLGIDILIPNVEYLVKNKHKIRGIIYTHGHLDHIGGAPFILPQLGFPPLFASRLTKELLFAQCSEHAGMVKKLKMTEINPKSKIKLGAFSFEFFHVNHSVPDGMGIVCRTPYGAIVHTSDFKFDYNPSDDQPVDLSRIAEIGKSGVALALVDSTNCMKPGHTPSESRIENHLESLISEIDGRIVLATFASNIGRISKIVEAAEKHGRTCFISGRSMERNLAIARKLNYLKCKENTLQLMSSKADRMNPKNVLILSTGSQGEEFAALTRMAMGTHRDIKLREDDTVIFSSSPIPGNEIAVVSVLNNLIEIGCRKIDNREMDLHVSGHAHAEECKLMTALLNPKFFAPIHGEVYMREHHRRMIIEDLQIKDENTFLMRNGLGIVLSKSGARMMTEKESVWGADVLVELGEKVNEKVLSDRKKMADSGILVVKIDHAGGKLKKVEIVSRGFLYMGMRHEIFANLEGRVREIWDKNYDPARPEKTLIQLVQKTIENECYSKIRKEPVVEVVI